ncbi:hypothetical protein [Nostoc sp.]
MEYSKTYAQVYGITNYRGAEDTWQIILRSLLTNGSISVKANIPDEKQDSCSLSLPKRGLGWVLQSFLQK